MAVGTAVITVVDTPHHLRTTAGEDITETTTMPNVSNASLSVSVGDLKKSGED